MIGSLRGPYGKVLTSKIAFGDIETLDFDIYKLHICFSNKFFQNKLVMPKVQLNTAKYIRAYVHVGWTILEINQNTHFTGSSSIIICSTWGGSNELI